MNVEQMVEYYLRTRAKIKEMDDAHKEATAPLKKALETLEGALLNAVQTTGGDSITAKGVGTVYKTTKKSASIADAALFRRHVIGAQDFELLDLKANVTVVEERIKKDGEPPPGVNFSTFVTVNVRKA